MNETCIWVTDMVGFLQGEAYRDPQKDSKKGILGSLGIPRDSKKGSLGTLWGRPGIPKSKNGRLGTPWNPKRDEEALGVSKRDPYGPNRL